jgi:hypothetical protein
MLRSAVLFLILVDVALLAGSAMGLTAIPQAAPVIGWAVASFALTFVVVWLSYFHSPAANAAVPVAIGVIGGILMAAHMILENVGTHLGEDWRLTLAVMVVTFGLWLSAGIWSARRRGTVSAAAIAGCWAAIVSVLLAIGFGFVGLYFDLPHGEYVATWPEFIRSGWSDPRAFAIANAMEAATSHLLTGLFLGSLLGALGGAIGSPRREP